MPIRPSVSRNLNPTLEKYLAPRPGQHVPVLRGGPGRRRPGRQGRGPGCGAGGGLLRRLPVPMLFEGSKALQVSLSAT